jgi:hypothetical protein
MRDGELGVMPGDIFKDAARALAPLADKPIPPTPGAYRAAHGHVGLLPDNELTRAKLFDALSHIEHLMYRTGITGKARRAAIIRRLNVTFRGKPELGPDACYNAEGGSHA